VSEEYAQYPWLLKGAYATYGGTAKVKPLPGEMDVTSRIEVEDIDLVNKRVKIHISSSAIQRIWRMTKKISDEEVSDWIKIGDRVIPSDTPYVVEGEYECVMRFPKLGVRGCIAQVCSLPKSTMVVFWDKEYAWPLAFISIFIYRRKTPSMTDEITSAITDMIRAITGFPTEELQETLKKSKHEVVREYSLAVSLKETNIPGLQV
jgi:hypothetical protein